MFFDICLLTALILQPFYIYFAYKVGRGEVINLKRKICGKPRKELSEEEKEQLLEWENILNYDGTKESQEAKDC